MGSISQNCGPTLIYVGQGDRKRRAVMLNGISMRHLLSVSILKLEVYGLYFVTLHELINDKTVGVGGSCLEFPYAVSLSRCGYAVELVKHFLPNGI